MNSSKVGLLALGLSIIAIGGVVMLIIIPPSKAPLNTTNNGQQQATTTTPGSATTTPDYSDLIVPNTPKVSATSLTIDGKARGTWYFEASFPMELRDASGKVIATAPAQAQSDWMTTEFVPFKGTLTFAKQPAGSKGTLVLKNDNPSGDPARDKSVEIPIVFK